jgi:hypothetical protein
VKNLLKENRVERQESRLFKEGFLEKMILTNLPSNSVCCEDYPLSTIESKKSKYN